MTSVVGSVQQNTLTQLEKFKGGEMRLRNRRKRFKQNWLKLFWLAITDGGIR